MNKLSNGIKLELIGMSLVLMATAWSLFFSDTAFHMFIDSSFYRVEEKLNTIWFTLADLYSHSEANSSGSSSSVNFTQVLNSWKDWREGQESLRAQKEMFSNIGGSVFILGSILIIVGKYLDAKKK